jgi:UPF0755 protein
MKKLFYTGLLFFVLAGIGCILFYTWCITPHRTDALPVTFVIPEGSTLNDTVSALHRHGLISSPLGFSILAKIRNAEHRIKSGEYRIIRPRSPSALLSKLMLGEVLTHPVTIPEGSTIFDIARTLEEAGFGSAESFIERAGEPCSVSPHYCDGETLEGYLFPDTYRFSKGVEPSAILRKMVMHFRKVYASEAARAQKQRLSRKEIVTLASMVEKETGHPEERPVIAAVFRNRLKKGMRMECDPTVIYGLQCINPSFDERLRKRHLQKKTPYNTYRIKGLPPGPICNPGRASIRAALNPADVDFLYFVSRNDGTHKFSRTFTEHLHAVNKFQR